MGQPQLRPFHDRWSGDRLVMDKWFASADRLRPRPTDAAAVTEALTRHKLFDWKNPNRFRSVIGRARRPIMPAFTTPRARAIALLADWLIRLDPLEPADGGADVDGVRDLARYDAGRQAKARAALERIKAAPGLSRDLGEMVGRILGA